ncbi:DDE-type integrase/transposase/recombinase [Aminobacter carboxidus]
MVWVDDFTYIRLAAGFCYLAVILDACSGKVVGYALSKRPDTPLALRASVPLNFVRVQNITAVRPRGVPVRVTARLECISTPHKVSTVGCPALRGCR